MPENYQMLALILVGGSLCLYASYQMIKRGLLTWLILLGIGIAAIQIGFARPNNSIQDLLRKVEARDLAGAPLHSLKQLCEGLDRLNE